MATTDDKRNRAVELALELARLNDHRSFTQTMTSLGMGSKIKMSISASDLVKDAKRIEQYLKDGS